MLVLSDNPKPSLSPDITDQVNDPTMAPVTDPFPIPGLEGLILENCKFLCSTDTQLSLIVIKEAGQFKAVVLQTKNDFRGPLLVETGPTIYWALHSLMVKSTESVRNYIQASGFLIVPGAKAQSKVGIESHESSAAKNKLGNDQEYDHKSVTSSTLCTLPCCSTHRQKRDKGKGASRRDREVDSRKQRGRTLRWRSLSSSRHGSHSRSRSHERCRPSSSSSGSESNTDRSRSGSRSPLTSRQSSNTRLKSGLLTHTGLPLPGPPANRFNVPYHNRMTSTRGTNPPPLPPPPPGWPVRNVGSNSGIGNGVSVNHIPPPLPAPPPPPPPPPMTMTRTSFVPPAGVGSGPYRQSQYQHTYPKPLTMDYHGQQAPRLADQYSSGPSMRHVPFSEHTPPFTTTFPSSLPTTSALQGISSSGPNGQVPKVDQSQHHHTLPPPPPSPPPSFPQICRGVSQYNGSAPWHVQRSVPHLAVGAVPPPPPPPPHPPVLHVPSSSSTSSSSSATITVTPNTSPTSPLSASSTVSSGSSGSSTASSSSPTSLNTGGNFNKPQQPAMITVIFPSHTHIIQPSQITILRALPNLSRSTIHAAIIGHFHMHRTIVKIIGGPNEETREVKIKTATGFKSVKAILGNSGPDTTGQDMRSDRKVVDISGFEACTPVEFLFDQAKNKVARFEVEVEVAFQEEKNNGGGLKELGRPELVGERITIGFGPAERVGSLPASIPPYTPTGASLPLPPPPPPPAPPPTLPPTLPMSMRMQQHIPPPHRYDHQDLAFIHSMRAYRCQQKPRPNVSHQDHHRHREEHNRHGHSDTKSGSPWRGNGKTRE